MIAFFDTNVDIDLLTGKFSLDAVLREIGSLPVRLSPVVASELLRGVSASSTVSTVSDLPKLINF